MCVIMSMSKYVIVPMICFEICNAVILRTLYTGNNLSDGMNTSSLETVQCQAEHNKNCAMSSWT